MPRTAIDGLPRDAARLRLSYIDGNPNAAAFYRARGFRYLHSESDSGGVENHWMELPFDGR